MVADMIVLFLMHRSIGIKLWQGLNQTQSSIPNTPIIPSTLQISIKTTRLMSSCCLCVYTSIKKTSLMSSCCLMSKADVLASTSIQDLLWGLFSLFTYSPRTTIFWCQSVWTTRNPAAQVLYTIVYILDLSGTTELPSW